LNVSLEILHACQRQDRRAQYDLYKACFPILMGVCMRYRRDRGEATAALNEGFLKICTSLDRWRVNEVPFEAWIRRIMINTLIDGFRRDQILRKNEQTTDPTEFLMTSKSFSLNEAESQISAEEILKIIEKLPKMSQIVFNLFVHDGLSHEEIANMCGISEGTSKWHLNAARTRLKELLTAHGIVR
jgi:RNA polymerase sigma factor (sigma-70 family)